MEHSGIDGCCHQVVGCCNGMNVTSQMEVELKGKKKKKRGKERYEKGTKAMTNGQSTRPLSRRWREANRSIPAWNSSEQLASRAKSSCYLFIGWIFVSMVFFKCVYIGHYGPFLSYY